MKRLAYHFLRSSLALSHCALLLTGTMVLAPSEAHAFGSLGENGTAAFMGIGTATPLKILHVTGTGVGTVPLFQRATDSAGFIIERTSENRWVFGVNESPTLGNGFVLSTIPVGSTSVPRLLVTQDGNVGIGTTSPTQGRLHVEDSTTAIYGKISYNDNYGYVGGTDVGVYGHGDGSMGTGVIGFAPTGTAVSGQCNSGTGYLGSSWDNAGVAGYSTKGYAGFFSGRVKITDNLSVADNLTVGTDNHEPLTRLTVVNDTAVNGSKAIYAEVTHTGDAQAVYGKHSNNNKGFLGDNTYGVYGNFNNGNKGYLGSVDYGAYGKYGASGPSGYLGGSNRGVSGQYSEDGPWGYLGGVNYGVYGNKGTGNYAGYFGGNVHVLGDLSASGTKPFVAPDPADPTKEIWYVALEGPEAVTFIRGSAELKGGQACIDLPTHFAKVTAEKGLTVQLTPVGKWLNLYVAEKSTGRIVVAEASGSDGSFDYFVNGVRAGYEDFQVVRDRPAGR
jgi:hypothetical protein